MLEHYACAAAQFDSEGQIQQRNAAWQTLCAGSEPPLCWHPYDHQCWLQSAPSQARIRLWNGLRWQACQALRIPAAGNSFFCLLVPLTESSAAEQVPTELIGNLVHSFNNHLSAMLGFCELALFDIAADHPAHAQISTVLESGNQAVVFTRDLLAVARRVVLRKEALDVSDWLAPLLALPGISLASTLPARRVEVDVAMTRRALQDIFQFFAEVTRHDMRVSLRSCRLADAQAGALGLMQGEYLRIDVQDDSNGMTPEQALHLFEPYFSTRAVRAKKGIGLAPAYGIWRQSGGWAAVFSEAAVGNHLVLLFPLLHERVHDSLQNSATAGSRATPIYSGHKSLLACVSPYEAAAALAAIDAAAEGEVVAWLTPEEAQAMNWTGCNAAKILTTQQEHLLWSGGDKRVLRI